jgi:elongator complex protein 1
LSELRETEQSHLVLFDFLSDDLILCLVFQSGAIYTIDVQNSTVTEVGAMPGPILGGAWSPDLQLLSLASDEMLFTISRDFDVISEETLRPTNPGKDQLMTVGWGSRETQFQGAAGRQKREKADENKIPQPLAESDDRRVCVSWRADAQFFTVNTVDEIPANNTDDAIEARQLRVWNREGELMSRCEVLAGMESVLAMRPNGNIIATTRVLNGVRSVWFFERNGQYRSHFDVGPSDGIKVEGLAWNLDSTVLTITLFHVEAQTCELKFWTVSNYDWALKLSIKLEERLVMLLWDPENSDRFHYLTHNGRYRNMHVTRRYHCCNLMAISVSGAKLRVTDLRAAPIPPPMCHYEVILPSTVRDICQSPNSLAILLSDGQIVICSGSSVWIFLIYGFRSFNR